MNNGHPDLGDPETAAQIQQIAQQVAPPITRPGQQLDEAERLKIENSFLKLQNMQLQVQNLDRAKADIIEGMRAEQQQMEKYRAELSAKYGTDISRTTVTAEGHIRPNGS